MHLACAPVEIKFRAKETHQVCSACLGLDHALAAISNTSLCAQCACFTAKSLRRRLACQASLSERDPILSRATTKEPQPGMEEEDTAKPEIRHWWRRGLWFLLRSTCTGSTSPARGSGEAITPQPSADIHDVCKRTAERLKAPRSWRRPQAKRAARHFLPVSSLTPAKPPFRLHLPWILKGWASMPWASRPWASRPWASMPPQEPLVAAHLHSRLTAASSRAFWLCLKQQVLLNATLYPSTFNICQVRAKLLWQSAIHFCFLYLKNTSCSQMFWGGCLREVILYLCLTILLFGLHA